MIINVRGCSGSGKSWVVRQIIKKMGRHPDPSGNCRKEGFYLDAGKGPPVFVLGRYGDSNTGGADTFKDMVDVEAIIVERAKGAHVIVEGIRVNGVYNRWLDLALARNGYPERLWLAPKHWLVIPLDTTLEMAKANVIARRAKTGKTEPLTDNLIHGIEDHFKRSIGHRPFLSGAGMAVHPMLSDAAVKAILKTVKLPLPKAPKGGWQ